MNARALPPDGITATQSYTWVLREVFIDKLVSLPFFAGFTVRRTRRVAIQPNQLPVLGVYIMDDGLTPDGDPNAGEIRFRVTARIGFQVVVINNDEVAAEAKLDQSFWAINNGLWRDAGVTNLIKAKSPDNVGFEAVMRGTRRHIWGTAGLNNETPVAELQYEASILYRDEFAVPVTDDLNSIHEQTAFPSDHDGSIDSVDQVDVVYDFTPSTVSELMHGTAQRRSMRHGRHQNPNATPTGAEASRQRRAQGGA